MQLRETVELLAEGRASEAIVQLKAQGRVHEVPNGGARLSAVVADYLQDPQKSLVISPDNRSRKAINRMVHSRLQAVGAIDSDEHRAMVLVNRQDLTGADRQWAAKYEPGNVIRYTRSSKVSGFERGEYATVTGIDVRKNLVTVERQNGQQVTYDPRRLQGVNVYEAQDREFSLGDRIQFTAPFRRERIANRELGTIERIDSDGNL